MNTLKVNDIFYMQNDLRKYTINTMQIDDKHFLDEIINGCKSFFVQTDRNSNFFNLISSQINPMKTGGTIKFKVNHGDNELVINFQSFDK